MSQAGLPVPEGVIITTDACAYYRDNKHVDHDSAWWWAQVVHEVHRLEKKTGLEFGKNLLLSVRSGAPVSMPGMMDTVLNVGLTDPETFGTDPVHAYKLYLTLLQQVSSSVWNFTSSRVSNPIKMAQSEIGGSPETWGAEEWRHCVWKVLVRLEKSISPSLFGTMLRS